MNFGKYIAIKGPVHVALVKSEDGKSTDQQVFDYEVARAKSVA